MIELARKKLCPFCPKQLLTYHDTPIIKSGRYWHMTYNDYPYDGAKYHLLLICKRHCQKLSQLQSKENKELWQFLSWAEKKFSLPGGVVLIRFGNTDYTGGSIDHLHLHLISGAKREPGRKPLIGYLGYQTKTKTASTKKLTR